MDADEVHAGEVCRLTVGVYRPVDVDGRSVAGVGLVIGISVCELVEGEVVSDSAQVDSVLGQPRAAERDLVFLDPLRIVGLEWVGFMDR